MTFLKAALLSAALIAPIAIAPIAFSADAPHSYHDKRHNDDHEWNDHENQAYHIYVKDNHRRDRDFSRLKENDRQSYWNWRHNHSDALLKIEIH